MSCLPPTTTPRAAPAALFAALSLALGARVLAGGGAAPSSHMVFDDAFAGDIVIHEVRVPEDGEAMFTYYETLGWRGKAAGYAGIQAHPRGRNFIFSIWDHDAHSAPIRALFHGAGTRTERFGGEGTGLKSWNFELGWETGTWYTLAIRCWRAGDHTRYAYWARSAATGGWTHLVTMDVAAAGAFIEGGTDAFIEDWLETGAERRTMHLRGGWKRAAAGGRWHPFGSARYSVNPWDLAEGKRSFDFRTNWDGGVREDDAGKFYYMTAGGATTRPTTTNPSRHAIARNPDEAAPTLAPLAVADASARRLGGGKIEVAWQVDPRGAPQFAFHASAHAGAAGPGAAAVAEAGGEIPHARRATITLPPGADAGGCTVRLQLTDLLDRQAAPVTVEVGG